MIADPLHPEMTSTRAMREGESDFRTPADPAAAMTLCC